MITDNQRSFDIELTLTLRVSGEGIRNALDIKKAVFRQLLHIFLIAGSLSVNPFEIILLLRNTHSIRQAC